MLADSILDGLNPEQRDAVQAVEGPLLVLAGAGSGKTRVLTSRVAYLIGVCGIAPEGILAVTFTNKAAGEMRERVQKLLGPDAEGLWCGTFHSTCVRILRRDIGHLGLSRGFVIYDDEDSLAVVKEALRRHDLDPKAHDARGLRWRIDQWKNQGALPAQAREHARDFEEEFASQIYTTYQKLLLDANALDFGDLLVQTVQLFERFPDVLAYYQKRWQFVLVDEYQDTNAVQYRFVNQLAGAHKNLCVVGDPDQSIYGWRGADIRNIMDFERDYEGARVVKLERNYRSTNPILEGATALVSHNVDRRDKKMFTEREGGDRIRLFEALNDREEAAYVVRKILEANRERAASYGSFAVLYRTNAQSRSFEEELLKYNVPYTVVGGVRFYSRAEIKDVLSYLRLLVNPTDDQSVRRIVNRPTRGIGKTTVDRATALAAERGVSLLDGLSLFAESATARTANRVKAFLQMMEELRTELGGRAVVEAVARVLDRTRYLRALEEEATPESEARIENLKELIASAEDFHLANVEFVDDERSELELYLDQVALITDIDDYQQKAERVCLMTAHSAKGLEFPTVFMVGMEEGIFPHASSEADPSGLEEERRLCYVGMTRAMERLYLSCAEERRRFGSRSFQSPSRFLSEIPGSLVDSEAGALGRRRGAARPRGRAGFDGDEFGPRDSSLDYSYSQEAPGEGGVARGTRVRHPIFGTGVVMAVVGEGLNQKLRIRFDRAGIKTVMVKYANLELA